MDATGAGLEIFLSKSELISPKKFPLKYWTGKIVKINDLKL